MRGSHSESRRLLILAPFPPRKDALHGGGRAIAHLVDGLADRHEIVLLCLRGPSAPPVDESLARRLVHVEEIGTARDASRLRVLLADYRGFLSGIPSWVRSAQSAEFGGRVREVVADWKPDIVQFEYPVMGQYIDALGDSTASRVLVEHDFAIAAARDVPIRRRGPAKVRALLELHTWKRFEGGLFEQMDAVVVFTERDAASVREFRAGTRVTVIPLGVEVPSRPLESAGGWPPTLLFVGSFVHEPNIDAAVRLTRFIFPRATKRFPDLRLDIVGHRPPREVRALAGPQVAVHADAPDITPYMNRASVVVVPVKFGGGMRVKVLEALAAGKAVVASPRALEGIGLKAGRHALVAESDEEFAAAVCELLVDRDRRASLGQAAHAWAQVNLSWDRSTDLLERLHASVISPPGDDTT